jgi:O-antigen/teichoic acid export membrane protein
MFIGKTKLRVINSIDSASGLSLKGKLSFLLKDTFFFGGLMAISQILPFIIIPILTSYFNLEEFGVYDNLLILSNLIAMIIVFGQDSAVARWFYEVDCKNERKKIVSESFLIQLLVSALILFLGLSFSENISLFFFKTTIYDEHVKTTLFSGFLMFINNFCINILKWSFKRFQYAIVLVSKALFQLVILLFAAFNKMELYEFLIVNMLLQLIICFLGLIFCFNYLIIPKEVQFLKKLLVFGIPIGLLSVTSSIIPTIERKIIIEWISIGNLGYYSLAIKIAAFIKICDSIFHLAWGPFSYSIFKDRDSQKIYRIVLNMYFIFFISALSVLWILTPNFIYFFGGVEYENSNKLVLPLLFGTFFIGLSGITGTGIDLSLKSYLKFIPLFFSIFTMITFNYFFIKRLGLLSVALSFMISNVLNFLVVSFLANYYYPAIRQNYFSYAVVGMIVFICFQLSDYYMLSVFMKIFYSVLILSIILYSLLDEDIRIGFIKIISKYKLKQYKD